MAESPNWTVTAIRYATMSSTRAHQFHRYEVYGEPDGALQMDYFFWLLDDGHRKILVDSGFHPDALRGRPGRECLVPPVDALTELGVAADEIEQVVVTHMHYDHIGNLQAFPDARYVLQRKELEFWTGRHGRRPAVAASVQQDEIEFLDAAARTGRVDLIDGPATVAPGVDVVLVGGHCPGQQVVRVTAQRPVVLCSDALHFAEEMDRDMPFNVFYDLGEMYDAYADMRAWRDEGVAVVAGHDPAVMADFPPLPGFEGLAVRLA